MRASAALLAVALAACGGSAAGPEAPRPGAVDERKAQKDAKALVTEIYDTLTRSSSTDGLMALLAEPLVVFGPRRADAHASRSDALVALRAVLDQQGKDARLSVRSGLLSVVAAPGGLSAWGVDVANVEGEPLAMTVVLSNDDDFWVVVAAALARTPSLKTVRAANAKDSVVPTALPGQGRVAGGADGAVARFKQGLADPDAWGADLTRRSEAVVIGPSSGAVARGKKAIGKLWKARAKVNTRYATAGELTASTTSDGQIAWVTAPVVQFADENDPLPLRLFAVFERDGGQWRMAALHEALAIDEPGVAANFKRVSPPAVKAEPPPPADSAPKPKKKKRRAS